MQRAVQAGKPPVATRAGRPPLHAGACWGQEKTPGRAITPDTTWGARPQSRRRRRRLGPIEDVGYQRLIHGLEACTKHPRYPKPGYHHEHVADDQIEHMHDEYSARIPTVTIRLQLVWLRVYA